MTNIANQNTFASSIKPKDLCIATVILKNSDFLYKTKGELKGISINSFCVGQGVPYNQFNNWFRKTHKKIVSVQIDGFPSYDEESANEAQHEIVKETGHVIVLIQNRDGLQIKKKNLTYPELKQLVEKLEGLC